MKNKTVGRVLRLLLCALLCAAALTGTALAFDGSSGEQAITIRITPPTGCAAQRAEVELCVTDHAGKGFASAQVQTGGGSWRDVTDDLELREDSWYTVAEITENCTVSVKVTGRDGTVYEKSAYIQCFDAAATPSAGPQPSAEPATPPGGQGTVIDNVSGTSEESGREFFTITTPDENVFYLVIDRSKDSENVYFLNAVTESDLMALAEKDTEEPAQSAIPDPAPVCACKEKCVPGAVNTDCPVCVLSYRDCTGTAPASSQNDPKPEQTKGGGGAGTMILVLVAALAVGGAGWYLKIYKPKHDLDNAEDLEELTGAAEEPAVNEDNLPDAYGEPDEPDYPDGYGDEP